MSDKISRWEISSDGYYPYCVNCHTEPPGKVLSPYCPNCGAMMENAKYAIKETTYINCKDSHKEMIDYIEPERLTRTKTPIRNAF